MSVSRAALPFRRYYGTQLHCHSSIEGPASIGAHCYEARRAGVEVVWLTDHDTRIALCIGGPFVDRFEFDTPGLATTVERTATGGGTVQRNVGWSVLRRDERLQRAEMAVSREQAYTGDQSMLIQVIAGSGAGENAGDEWQRFVVDFKADSKMHSRPVFAGAMVGLALRLESSASGDADAWVDLVLSEQPPDLRQGRLRYLLAPEGANGTHEPEERDRYRTRVIRLTAPLGQWQRYQFRPGIDADADGLGGTDNALHGLRIGVRVRRGAQIKLFVDHLTIAHECAGNELHARQRELAHELARRHGVVCHVGQEISQAGQHKNAWGSSVPILDYPGNLGGFTHDQGVAWAKRHGAVFSLNHPFNRYNRRELTGPERDRIVAEMIEQYAATRASGANTLEVGFPAGRHSFPLEYYLRLWDGLLARGVYILGNGSNDAHSARVGWQSGNNFANFIRADSPDEESLLAGLRAGDFYMADPVRFRSRLAFGDRAGHRMGQVVPLRETSAPRHEVVLALDQAQPQWQLCWVVDGERRPPVGLGQGQVAQSLVVDTSRTSFVRAEIWDPTLDAEGSTGGASTGGAGGASASAPASAPVTGPGRTTGTTSGRCVALTNPIIYHRGLLPDSLPPERLA